jgi:hypothetical protein
MNLEWVEETYDISLSKDEYDEMIGLEYVLTHGYSDDIDKDETRYKELSKRHDYGI